MSPGPLSSRYRTALVTGASTGLGLAFTEMLLNEGVEVWGTAAIHTDLETKKRLWTGVFDYDLNAFSPGGPEGSPDMGFMSVKPERALVLKAYGMGGRETWKAS